MGEERRVLIVEDNPDERRMAATALASAGFRVLESDGVEVGLHLFRTQQPDLVILDVELPDGSGVEACRKLREHKSQATTPVIMLTGRSGVEDKASGFDAGADQYLVKPVDPRELVLWVRALLRRRVLAVSVPDFPADGRLSSRCRPLGATGRTHGEHDAGGRACGRARGGGAVRALARRQAGLGANTRETLEGRRKAVRGLQPSSGVALAAPEPHGSAKAGG